MRQFVLLAVTVLAAGFALNPARAAADTQFDVARAEFLQASSGSGSLDKAIKQFAALVKSEPLNPVYTAYHAAALTMRARDTYLPWKKMSYTEEGVEQLEKALSLIKPEHGTQRLGGVPMAMQTRMVVATTFLALPGFMNRGSQGAKLLDAVLDDPQFAGTPRGFQISALRNAAKSSKGDPEKIAARKQQLAALESTPSQQAQKVQK